jgi:hypothetical protein
VRRAVARCPAAWSGWQEPASRLVAIDYAHTPDALDKALLALRPLATQRGGVLWCVFGCGGERDATKRPLMAAVAEKNADRVVVTSDNPRHEKPENIISQILLGLSRRDCVQVQADRARAIAADGGRGGAGDVVLLAGKGHEDYQEIAGVKHPFSDRRMRALLWRREGCHEHVHTGSRRLCGFLAQTWWATAGVAIDRVHTDTRTLLPATCSSRSRASALTPTTSWPTHLRKAPWRPSPGAAGIPAGASGIEVDRHAHRAGSARSRLARAVQPATDRGDRQQRQDHRDADDRVHPARLAGRCLAGHAGQPQQRHRRAAHAAAPARIAQGRRGGDWA